jgi:hypothetical protein
MAGVEDHEKEEQTVGREVLGEVALKWSWK